MKTILVTGCNGYIGKHVVEYLQSNTTHRIIGVDLKKNNENTNRINYIGLDFLSVASQKDLFTILGNPDCCIHLAWQDGFNHSAPSHIKNLYSHYSFLQNIIDAGCKSISVMGTMHEIGFYEGEINANTPCNPLSNYGIAKNALRQLLFSYCENKNISVKWLRAFYITGDDKNNKSIFAKIMQIAKEGGKTFPFTDGLNKYDFIDVVTLASYISQASLQDEINGIINVCSGTPIALKDKVESFIKEKRLDISLEYGAFPSRKYDSPAIWGNSDLIKKIIKK